MIFDIVQGVNTGRSKAISVNDLVNFYPEVEAQGKSKCIKAIIGTPGYRKAVDMQTAGSCRMLYASSNGRLFAIFLGVLYEILEPETYVSRGNINTTSNSCKASDNGTQIFIVDGTYGYIYNMSTDTLAEITDSDFPENPTASIFTDGYFITNSSGSGQFYFSASYDGMSWDSLDFATAEYSADSLVAIEKTSNGTIWMLGSSSLELWSNIGTADLPWARISGCVKEVGCLAPYSASSNGDQVFFVGNGKNGYASVYMGIGYDVIKISTPAIEYAIKQISNVEDATSFCYSDEGHSFYVLNFSYEKTLVYDLTTGEWHRRGTLNNGVNLRCLAENCAFFNGKYYVGSRYGGYVYEMSLDLYDEDGTNIKREIVTNEVSEENKLLRHTTIELSLENGVGTVNDDAPAIMMRFSNDGGYTWSNERSSTPGEIGSYNTRSKFLRLGTARKRVYEFTFSDNVKWIITGMYIEVI
jgi:hypothetical protein